MPQEPGRNLMMREATNLRKSEWTKAPGEHFLSLSKEHLVIWKLTR